MPNCGPTGFHISFFLAGKGKGHFPTAIPIDIWVSPGCCPTPASQSPLPHSPAASLTSSSFGWAPPSNTLPKAGPSTHCLDALPSPIARLSSSMWLHVPQQRHGTHFEAPGSVPNTPITNLRQPTGHRLLFFSPPFSNSADL